MDFFTRKKTYPRKKMFSNIQRHKNKTIRKNMKPKIIIGKIYATWCGHCVSLQPEWKLMKKEIMSAIPDKKSILFVAIEQTDLDKKLHRFYNKYKLTTMEKDGLDNVKGFPTIFKIKNGKIEYYEGERQAGPMKDWVLQ